MADRHDGKAAALLTTRQRGAHLVVRIIAHYLKVRTRTGEPFDLLAALQAARPAATSHVRRAGVRSFHWSDDPGLD